MASRAAQRLRALLDARGELDTPLISVYEWADTANASDAAQQLRPCMRTGRRSPRLMPWESLGATPSAR